MLTLICRQARFLILNHMLVGVVPMSVWQQYPYSKEAHCVSILQFKAPMQNCTHAQVYGTSEANMYIYIKPGSHREQGVNVKKSLLTQALDILRQQQGRWAYGITSSPCWRCMADMLEDNIALKNSSTGLKKGSCDPLHNTPTHFIYCTVLFTQYNKQKKECIYTMKM